MISRPDPIEELSQIAYDLLEEWYASECMVVYEYSGNTIEDRRKIDIEYNMTKSRIAQLKKKATENADRLPNQPAEV